MDIKEQHVIMSPLLSERFIKIEKKLEAIQENIEQVDNKFNQILDLLNENSQRWEENRKEYIELLKSNHNISEKNLTILNENRTVYLDAINKIDDNKLRPLLTKLEDNNNKLLNNNIDSRVYNRYWRTSGNNTIMQPSNAGIASILNFPWSMGKLSENKN